MTGGAPASGAKVGCEVNARGIATVLLHRPDRGNALDPDMLGLLSEIFVSLRDRQDVRAVVLRGSGRHFCTGMDVAAIGKAGAASPEVPDIGQLCLMADQMPKPIIAAVHGAALGGGCALVACCDIALATPEASFALPEVRLGLAPSALSPFFIRALGARQARRYILSGETLSGAQAAVLGLVHEICDAENLDGRIAQIADACLRAAPGAFAVAKASLRILDPRAIDQALLAGLERQFGRNAGGAEAQEGKAAFREKRNPSWYVPNP